MKRRKRVSTQRMKRSQLRIHPLCNWKYTLVCTVASRNGLIFKHLKGTTPFREEHKIAWSQTRQVYEVDHTSLVFPLSDDSLCSWLKQMNAFHLETRAGHSLTARFVEVSESEPVKQYQQPQMPPCTPTLTFTNNALGALAILLPNNNGGSDLNKSKQHERKEASDNEPLQPLLTIADVCTLLHISRPTIYVLIDQGLPVMKFGKAVRFSPTSLQRWLARREEFA